MPAETGNRETNPGQVASDASFPFLPPEPLRQVELNLRRTRLGVMHLWECLGISGNTWACLGMPRHLWECLGVSGNAPESLGKPWQLRE